MKKIKNIKVSYKDLNKIINSCDYDNKCHIMYHTKIDKEFYMSNPQCTMGEKVMTQKDKNFVFTTEDCSLHVFNEMKNQLEILKRKEPDSIFAMTWIPFAVIDFELNESYCCNPEEIKEILNEAKI